MRNPKPIKPTQKAARAFAEDVNKPLVVDPIVQAMKDALAEGLDVEGTINKFSQYGRLELENVSDFRRNALLLAHFSEASEAHKEKIAKAFHAAIKVDVRPFIAREPGVDRFIQESIRHNVSLITRIGPEIVSDVVAKTQAAFAREPFSRDAMARHFERALNKSGWPLQRLARDQTSKATGQFNHIRQVRLGVQKYVWIDSGDNRVRATHRENNDKPFYWDQPPATGHPGEDILCRCTAEAQMDLDVLRYLGG